MKRNELNAIKMLFDIYYSAIGSMMVLQKHLYRSVLRQYQEHFTKKYISYIVFDATENIRLGLVNSFIFDPHYSPYPTVELNQGSISRCYMLSAVNLCKP